MYSLILKITHNTAIKDTIAIARGIYRVTESVLPGSSSNQVRVSSWMDDIKDIEVDRKGEGKLKEKAVANKQDSTEERKNESQSTYKIVNPIFRYDIMQKQEKISVKTQQPKIIKSQKYNSTQKLNQQNQSKTESSTSTSKQYLKQFKQIPTTSAHTYQPQISKIPSSRFGRIVEFGKLGLNLATASIFSRSKDEAHYQEIAEKVSSQLCKMRGAPLKLAQMLSIQQENLIPTPIRKAFEKARQSAHVIPKEQVQYMLTQNLGENWRSKFKHFNQIPFASASIGQVHRATLLNNQQVAIKVQYHGVRQSINSDIQNLGLLLKIPGIMPKGMYVERILAKTKQQLMQQCDYLKQKFYQQKYKYYLNKSFGKQASLYRVPSIYPQYSSAQILTSTFLSGIKIKQFEQQSYPQQLKDQIGRRIMKLTFKQLFEMGIMQSDPNPSNYTYNHTTDELNLFDFGATHIYKKQFLESYYQIISGSVKQNNDQIWQGSIKTGFITGEENMAMKNSHIESILITGEPLRYEGKYDFGSQEITSRIYKTIPLMLKNRLKPPPEEVYSLHRKLSGSYLACIRLKARVDCSKIWKEISFQTLASHEKYQSPSNQNKIN